MRKLTFVCFLILTFITKLSILHATEVPVVINGVVDATGAYSAVAQFRGGGCSAVLVAPRVMLTSAHCLADHVLGCTNLASNSLSVTFAETNGGWSSQASYDARTVQIQGFVFQSTIFDLAACNSGDTYSCPYVAANDRITIDHAREMVVLYLADDAPSDVTPLPILINPAVDRTHSAAEVGIYLNLETWVQNNEPVVTTVGYGVGSEAYTVGSNQMRGRDYGVQKWVGISSDYAGFLGAVNCNQLAANIARPAVVAFAEDLTLDMIGGNPGMVAAGDDFSGSSYSHSGGGDSGGPILVGKGISAKGVSPTPLPGPSSGNTYDPNKNYVAGTASLWVSSGQDLKTAFNPTWTIAASNFLMDALYDNDGDGYADPVDDDRDGDGCNNDVDQHPDDRWVEVGVTIHPNCNPSKSPIYGDESLDTDGDGLSNCEDTDDDGDGILDDDDPCPINANQDCVEYGFSCPWAPLFFDCRLGGCNELLIRISSLINPDPTREVFLSVLSVSRREIVVLPAAGFSLQQSAEMLAGIEVQARLLETPEMARSVATPGPSAKRAISSSRVLLEAIGADGIRGTFAAYQPSEACIRKFQRKDNALRVCIGKDGESIKISGCQVALPNRR